VPVVFGKDLEDHCQGWASNGSGHIVEVFKGVFPGDSITGSSMIGIVRVHQSLFDLMLVIMITEFSQSGFNQGLSCPIKSICTQVQRGS
jgi:hypothetical protein